MSLTGFKRNAKITTSCNRIEQSDILSLLSNDPFWQNDFISLYVRNETDSPYIEYLINSGSIV